MIGSQTQPTTGLIFRQTNPATLPTDLVRLQEFLSALQGYIAIDSGIPNAEVIGLEPLILQLSGENADDSATIEFLTTDSGALSANVKVSPAGGLTTDAAGVKIIFGPTGAAPFNHTHSGLPIRPITVQNGGTISFGSFNSLVIPAAPGQNILTLSAEVVAVPLGGILATALGLQLDYGPNPWQAARGSDVQLLIDEVAGLTAEQGSGPTGLAQILFERLDYCPSGQYVGGRYSWPTETILTNVSITADGGGSGAVFTLELSGVLQAVTIGIPAGAGQVSASKDVVVSVPAGSWARWVCTSGTTNAPDAPSRIDLVTWARLAPETSGGLLTLTENILFERLDVLNVGEHVGGEYAWAVDTVLTGVNVTATKGATAANLTLEVDGAAQAVVVTIPAGSGDYSSGEQAVNVAILAGSKARWVCTSGDVTPANNPSRVDLINAVSLSSPYSPAALELAAMLDPNGGLQFTIAGLGCAFGAGHTQVARGDHTHAQLHNAVTAVNTPTLRLIIDPVTQALSGAPVLDLSPSTGFGLIFGGPNGLSIPFGTDGSHAAAGDHTHDLVNLDTSGLMSPEMFAGLLSATGMQTATLTAAINSIDQSVLFTRESALPSGAYVGGRHRWSNSMELIGVELTASAPLGDTMLQLEVGGILQPTKIMVPSGLPNTEVANQITLGGIFLTVASQWTPYMRWQCVSGGQSGPENWASQINLTVNIRPAVNFGANGLGLLPPGFSP